MKKLVVLFAILILTPTLVSAQIDTYPTEFWNPQALAEWLFPGMSKDWVRMPNLIYYVIVPFITAVAVIYGILGQLRIFRDWKTNLIISLCFAFLLLPSGILTTIVNIFYATGAFIGLISFGVLFVVGTLLWAVGRGYGLYTETGVKEIREIRRNISKLNEEQGRILREIGREVGGIVRESDILYIDPNNDDEYPLTWKKRGKVKNRVKNLVKSYQKNNKKIENLNKELRTKGLTT